MRHCKKIMKMNAIGSEVIEMADRFVSYYLWQKSGNPKEIFYEVW